MKVGRRGERVNLSITRYEALLIKDALYDFQQDRSETQAWDSQNDPIIVSQMVKAMEPID